MSAVNKNPGLQDREPQGSPYSALLGWPLLHWIKCPASNMSCIQRVFGESPLDFRFLGSVSLSLLCESNQVANQGACSACFRCFRVCSCNMIIVAVHDSVWHHLTSGNCTAWSQLLELQNPQEVPFCLSESSIKGSKDRKSCLKSAPTSLGKIDRLISRHRHQIPRHSRQVSTGSRSLPSLCGFKGGFSVIKTSVDRSGSSSWGLILKPT